MKVLDLLRITNEHSLCEVDGNKYYFNNCVLKLNGYQVFCIEVDETFANIVYDSDLGIDDNYTALENNEPFELYVRSGLI